MCPAASEDPVEPGNAIANNGNITGTTSKSARRWHFRIAAITVLAAFIYNLYVSPIGLIGYLISFILLPVLIPVLVMISLGFYDAYDFKLRKRRSSHAIISSVSPPHQKWLSFTWVALCVAVFVCLCWYDIPRKTAILAFNPEFKSLQKSPLTPPAKDTWVGPWRVIQAETDERGGLYIVVNEAIDLIDTISEGPAYNPNPSGSPFGRADYSLTHLHGDWYWFHASSDW